LGRREAEDFRVALGKKRFQSIARDLRRSTLCVFIAKKPRYDFRPTGQILFPTTFQAGILSLANSSDQWLAPKRLSMPLGLHRESIASGG
jgi:hypothetical protein